MYTLVLLRGYETQYIASIKVLGKAQESHLHDSTSDIQWRPCYGLLLATLLHVTRDVLL